MSLQPTLTPYLRSLNVAKKNVRTFAAAAAGKTKEAPSGSSGDSYLKPREDVKTSKANNVTVSSIETNKPISKLAVFFRAGSRFETDDTQGVSQMLRIAAGLGTSGASQFGITRQVEQAGGNLYCTSGREYISYTLETTRDKIGNVDRYLQDVAVYQAFKPWELKDNIPRLRLERTNRPPEVRVLDLIHKSAYRKGLGYSLYSPKWMIGNHTSEMLQNFVSSNFGQACVVGIGLPHEKVVEFASRLNIKGEVGKPLPGQFHPGSEVRKETNDSLAYVALAIEGAGISNQKGQVASALAQRVLGAGARTKRGLNAGGKLQSGVVSGNENEVAATAISASYADSGLLGVVIASTPSLIDQSTRKAADALLRTSATEEEVARAKNQLKADLAIATETDSGSLEELGLQTLLTGKVVSQSELNSLVDSVTASDVNGIIQKGKLSMASYGNIANVPFIDQLKN
ncbi:unnamed protein product [Orchesella dallaii]|uniref:Cytochrome b-c1 complex subunit 2, mitochondrial n=1 Tax=Orchesella dallaii TaxID=48710 RepID=A0ABP1QUR5_9HEXA